MAASLANALPTQPLPNPWFPNLPVPLLLAMMVAAEKISKAPLVMLRAHTEDAAHPMATAVLLMDTA